MDEKDFNIGDILDVNNEDEASETPDNSVGDAPDIELPASALSAAFAGNVGVDDSSEDLSEAVQTNMSADEDEASDEDVEADDGSAEDEDSEELDTEPTEQDTYDDTDDTYDDGEYEDEYDDEYSDDEYEDEYDDEYYDDDEYYERAPRRSSPVKKKSKVNNSIFGGLILVTIILTVSLVVAISGIKLGMEYLGVGKAEDEITFNIPENMNSDQITDMLIDYNLIKNKSLFKVALKIHHSPTLFPGDVTLKPSMGYSKIIETLSSRRDLRETVRITFQEGMTLLEIANKLEEKNVCSATDFIFQFNKQQDFAFEKLIDMNTDTYYKMEGFCFPDTYEFYVDDTGSNAARVIKANFANRFSEEMIRKMQQKNMTINEVITIASIVQWEANSAKDMPKVASVFLNRLDNKATFPMLESDATKKYISKGIEKDVDNATKDYYTKLYDTYQCEGLPAGPVCNPGLDAINAVLDPDKTNYYFFCNNLSTGESFFAETYEEHQQNLIKAGLL